MILVSFTTAALLLTLIIAIKMLLILMYEILSKIKDRHS